MKLYKVAEVATLFDVTPETIRRWARSGALPSVKKKGSSHWLFSKEEIDSMIEEGHHPGEPELITPRNAIADRDYDLNSSSTVPSPEYFVKIVHHIAEFVERLEDVETVDGPYDKKRDIIGYKRVRHQKRELHYIQCKKKREISEESLKKELNDLKAYLDDPKKQPLIKPDKIIFALSSNVIATVRDKAKDYCQTLIGVPLVFWCPKELNAKIKSEPRVQRLIEPDIFAPNIEVDVGRGSYSLRRDALYQDQETKLNKSLIKKSGELIQQGKVLEAKDFLLEFIGKLNIDIVANRSELAGAYNNLGLCYTKVTLGYNDSKAIEHFEKALELDTDSIKARGNLILILLKSSGNKQKVSYHRMKLESLLQDTEMSNDDYFFVLYVVIASLEATEGTQQAIAFMERILKSEALKDRGLQDDKDLLHILGFLYFRAHDLKRATAIVSNNLAKDPKHFESLYLSTLLNLAESFSEEQGKHDHDLLPDFSDANKIETTYEILAELVQRAQDESREDMLDELKHNLFLCATWLQRFGGKDLPFVPQIEFADQIDVVVYSKNIYEKHFKEAYDQYLAMMGKFNFSPGDKSQVAQMFAHYGAPEYAQKIYDENEKALEKYAGFWLDRSVVEILMGNTDLAKEFAFRAKELIPEHVPEAKKAILGHVGAVLLRDPKEGERILKNTIEMQEAFPDEKILTGFNLERDKDKIIEIFSNDRDRAEQLIELYKTNTVPSYMLETARGKTFFECWLQRDFRFPLAVTEPAPAFYQEQLRLLHENKEVILDYQSLLSLTQAKMLGYLERITCEIYVDFALFEKVQAELIKTEHPTLREAWDYLRSSRVKFLYCEIEISGELRKLRGVLDEWLLRSIKLAGKRGMIFVCDDLPTHKLALNEGAGTVNTFGILHHLRVEKLIDKKAYSKKIGQLAKCYYTFISFDPEDLHEIIWQDDYGITGGTYHLIAQMHLPGSEPHSFLNVFRGFIALLWRSGATSEDKIKWLDLINSEVSAYIQHEIEKGEKATEELRAIVSSFVDVWIEAINAAPRPDDLNELKAKLDDVSGVLLKGMRQNIATFIDMRIKKLNEGS